MEEVVNSEPPEWVPENNRPEVAGVEGGDFVGAGLLYSVEGSNVNRWQGRSYMLKEAGREEAVRDEIGEAGRDDMIGAKEAGRDEMIGGKEAGRDETIGGKEAGRDETIGGKEAGRDETIGGKEAGRDETIGGKEAGRDETGEGKEKGSHEIMGGKEAGRDEMRKEASSNEILKEACRDEIGKEACRDEIGKEVVIDAIGMELGRNEIGKEVGIDEIGKEVGRDEIGMKVGIDVIGKELGRDEIGKEVGIDEIGKEVGRDEIGMEVGIDAIGKELGRDEIGKEVGIDEIGKEVGRDEIGKVAGRDEKTSTVTDNDDNIKLHSTVNDEGDRNYESEPGSVKKIESRKKLRKRANWNNNNQGRGNFTRPHAVSKEMRELSRKHAILEKNLKIEGLPEPPPKLRKRRLSLSSNIGRSHDKDVTPYKRNRLASVDSRPKKDHMPKWELMGGDANDPLNLNGLAHSEEGRLLNLKTPESSPLPTPDFRKIVYVKVPPNIEDPLNLEGKHDQRVIDKMLNSTVKKRHRSKKKKHDDNQLVPADAAASSTNQLCTNNSVEVAVAETSTMEADSQIIVERLKDNVESKPMDILPTTAKPVALLGRRSRSISTSPERKFRRQLSGGKGKAGANEPKKFPDKPKFTLGNYNRYYGYRNKDHVPDPRLQYFDRSWFKGKDVLDIGCNVGHITLAVAEHFQPHKILGMDIDAKLIQAARQNIRHMLSMRRKDSARCPRVFEMTRGPLEAHPLMGLSDNFPNNVLFLQGNYVPGSEEILNLQKEELDTILALSITKWIQLNNGDNGLKLFFQKIYRQLRPGGRLILEPQPWSTYRKRAKLSPELFAKYQSIKLKPEGFKHYLLSIGFVKCEVIGVPVTKSKGFRRPLILFTKGDNRQTPIVMTGEELDVRDVCQECGNTNKSLCDHPQFTGMRRGPYASHMYDHINYPYMSSDSPYVSSSRTYSNHSVVMHGSDDNTLNPVEGDCHIGAGRRSDTSGDLPDNGEGWGTSEVTDSSSGSSVIRAQSSSSSCSSSSSSSYESPSDSISSRSFNSSNINGSDSAWSSSSYLTPEPNGAYNPSNDEPNGDIEH